jgi:hypothetical protein
MNIKSLIVLFFLSLSLSIYSQSSDKEFQMKFNQAKTHLSHRKMMKALPILYNLYQLDSLNSNINYLIGVCFVEGEIITERSIFHLKKAIKDASAKYDSDSHEEKNAPIYVHYYLSIAYSQNKQCDLAINARNNFMEIYTYDDQYYPRESQRWLDKCNVDEELVPADLEFLVVEEVLPVEQKKTEEAAEYSLPLVSFQSVKKEEPIQEIKDSEPFKPSSFVTKEIEYTTNMPLYGVQVGAFKEMMPVLRYPDLKNVDAFVDSTGWVRYVVGHFSYRSQAESLKKVIIDAGYPDAFIVDVNKDKKYAENVISIDNVSLKSTITGKIEFRVQLGAFKEEIPTEIAENYLKISHLEQYTINNITYLSSVGFPSYTQAIQAKDQYVKIGVSDAFIVAFNKKKKIPLIDALNYTHENPANNLQ